MYAFRLNFVPFCFLAGGVPATRNASILFCFFRFFFDYFLFFWQVAFPPEDFEEIALVKRKGGKQKDSAKKQHLNKLMGKKN